MNWDICGSHSDVRFSFPATSQHVDCKMLPICLMSVCSHFQRPPVQGNNCP